MSDDEFVTVLIRELKENIRVIEEGSLILEKNSKNEIAYQDVKMALHSVKGLYGFLSDRFSKIRVITHQVEDSYLQDVSSSISILLKYVDNTSTLISRIEKNNSTEVNVDDLFSEIISELNPDFNIDQRYKINVTFVETSTMKTARMLSLINKLKRISSIEKSIPDVDELFEIDDFAEGLIEITTRESKHSISDAIQRIPEVISFSINEIHVEKGNTTLKEKSSIVSSKVEIEVKQLDKIINMVEEFILVGSLINKLDLSSLSSSDIDIFSSFNQRVVDMQNIILSLKQIPADVILRPIPRMIRDLTANLNKKVSVYVSGGQIGVDRPIIETLSDILVILVQNSVIHGIETEDIRLKKGKTSSGTLSVSVQLEEGSIEFTVSDDGKGLDPKNLWDRGIEIGLIDKFDVFDEEIAKDLIFVSGFSTSKNSDTTSGRGVGLSSVKNDIENLGGIINIKSTMNEGTTFKINIPLIKPIAPVIILTVGKYTFGFPQTGVHSIERLKSTMINKLKKESVINQEQFLLTSSDQEVKTINLISKFANNNSNTDNLSLIHWSFAGHNYSFLVNEIKEISDLAINYEDPFIDKISYISGTSQIEADKILLILKPRAFI